MSNKIGVALTKEVCPICLKEQSGEIIINSRLTEYNAQQVEKMHGKVTGFSAKPCKECQKKYKGRIAFISIDVSKSNPETPHNPWRTGFIAGIKYKLVKKMFSKKMYIRMLKFKLTYIDEREMKSVLNILGVKEEN